MKLGHDAMYRQQDMAIDDGLEFLRSQLSLTFTTEDLREGVPPSSKNASRSGRDGERGRSAAAGGVRRDRVGGDHRFDFVDRACRRAGLRPLRVRPSRLRRRSSRRSSRRSRPCRRSDRAQIGAAQAPLQRADAAAAEVEASPGVRRPSVPLLVATAAPPGADLEARRRGREAAAAFVGQGEVLGRAAVGAVAAAATPPATRAQHAGDGREDETHRVELMGRGGVR